MSRRYVLVAAAALGAAQNARAAVFSHYVLGSYTQGTIYNSDGSIDTYDMGFDDPTVVGDPASSGVVPGLTNLDFGFPEIISPFDPPSDADQIVTIGYGGSITLQFPKPIDVLNSAPTIGVFTAAGLVDNDYPDGTATDPASVFGTYSAVVSVSKDGVHWVALDMGAPQTFDIPENYYANASDPYQFPAPTPAEIADFGQPFTGTLDSFDGEGFSDILATLNGSAGGTWLDLSGTGLDQINYVQFSEPTASMDNTLFLALQGVTVNDAAVPEPTGSIFLMGLAGLCLRRARRQAKGLLIVALALLGFASVSKAQPVNSIQFYDGNVLNIQGSYGSGSDSAYLVVDFPNPVQDLAWQFNFDSTATVNGWQMVEDIAGDSILSTKGTPGTTNVSNPSGDQNYTITAEYFPSFAEHLVTNMQYGSNIGTDNWDFYTGTYDSSNLSGSEPQGVPWQASGKGLDETSPLTNDEFIGFIDTAKLSPPVAPETELPEPTSAAGLMTLAGFALRRKI